MKKRVSGYTNRQNGTQMKKNQDVENRQQYKFQLNVNAFSKKVWFFMPATK